MKVRFLNYQNKSDPQNGAAFTQRTRLSELLDRRRSEPPFLAELLGDNGYHIEFGIGGDVGCVQHSRADGRAPFLMAISFLPPMKKGYAEFLTANTPTAFAARYIITFDELKEIAFYFLETGERSDSVLWREHDPKAIIEDAGPAGLP
jgi:hypothetical protein